MRRPRTVRHSLPPTCGPTPRTHTPPAPIPLRKRQLELRRPLPCPTLSRAHAISSHPRAEHSIHLPQPHKTLNSNTQFIRYPLIAHHVAHRDDAIRTSQRRTSNRAESSSARASPDLSVKPSMRSLSESPRTQAQGVALRVATSHFEQSRVSQGLPRGKAVSAEIRCRTIACNRRCVLSPIPHALPPKLSQGRTSNRAESSSMEGRFAGGRAGPVASRTRSLLYDLFCDFGGWRKRVRQWAVG
jgi:hypothetical protein